MLTYFFRKVGFSMGHYLKQFRRFICFGIGVPAFKSNAVIGIETAYGHGIGLTMIYKHVGIKGRLLNVNRLDMGGQQHTAVL